MAAERIAARDAGTYVNRRLEFKTHNGTIIGTQRGDLYVVYSYGEHFPMYIYSSMLDEWFGNKDKYSRTTSKHQGQARPRRVDRLFDTETMQRIARMGFSEAVAMQLEGA